MDCKSVLTIQLPLRWPIPFSFCNLESDVDGTIQFLADKHKRGPCERPLFLLVDNNYQDNKNAFL